jgi:hypothetical protein
MTMVINKTKIFLGYITIKSSLYLFQKKEEIQTVIDLFFTELYSQSLENSLIIISDMIEYISKLSLNTEF